MAAALDAYEQYMHDIRTYPRISPEREVVLSEIINDGRNPEMVEAAIDELVTSNLLLVVHCLKDFRSYLSAGSCCITEMDLIAEGNVALMNAARHFDAHRAETAGRVGADPIRFSSYACRIIKNAMRRALKLARLVHIPEYHFRCWTQLDELEEQYGDALSDDMAARKLGVRRKVVRMLRKSRDLGVCSLEALTPEDGASWHDLIADPRGSTPHDTVSGNDLRSYLVAEMDNLPERTRKMLGMVYLQEDKATLADLSSVFGVSMERCRQICARGLKSLRNNLVKRIEKVLGTEAFEQQETQIALAVARWLDPGIVLLQTGIEPYASVQAGHDAA
jgi:RNA polymerase sigma factor (sigma-70 family)